MELHIKPSKTTTVLLLLLLGVGVVNLHAATLSATATFSDSLVSPGVYQYIMTLNNTGSTTIGTFWFSWIPGFGFMTVAPTNILSPAGWTGATTNSNASIMWVDTGLLAAGASVTGFEFDSTLTPAQLEGPSSIPGDPVATSFVYIAAPFGDPGSQLVVTPAPSTVPEPATLLLTGLALGLSGLVRKAFC